MNPKDLPLVSVVIISHQTPSLLLERCIQSVRQQSLSQCRTELILVDTNDKSSSYSQGLMEDLSSYPEIIYHSYPDARNLAYAKNAGLDKCQGDYICFLYAKDFWSDHWLEPMLKPMLENSSLYCVCCPMTLQEPDILNKTEETEVQTGFSYLAQLLLRKECFTKAGNFDPFLVDHIDRDFWFRVTQNLPVFYLNHNAVVSHVNHTISFVPAKASAIGCRQLYTKYKKYYKTHRAEKKELFNQTARYYRKAHHYSRTIQFIILAKLTFSADHRERNRLSHAGKELS